MSFEFHIIEPKVTTKPNVLGLYPYPIAGTIANTGDRLQKMVDLTGFPVVASDLLLQRKKMIFDMKAKQANSPNGAPYRDMSLRRGEFFTTIADLSLRPI